MAVLNSASQGLRKLHSLPNNLLMWGAACCTLALVYEQAREGSVLVAGNFNVTADICLSQHRKTKKELKKKKK